MEEPLEQGRAAEPQFFLLIEKLTTLVAIYTLIGTYSIDGIALDFMAIRKIPLTERPYLLADNLEADVIDRSESPEDPSVSVALSTARTLVLADRALNDKVGVLVSLTGRSVDFEPRLQRHMSLSFVPTRNMKLRTSSA